jgi:hypothetical protein
MPQTTGSIRLNLVDGTRAPLAPATTVLVRILDGRKQSVATQWVTGETIIIPGLPFHDSPDDWYTIIVHADGYEDAGLYPVRLRAGVLIDAYAMLLPKDGTFHFCPIEALQNSLLYNLVANGAPGSVADRYSNTLENKPMELGALLTIGTAIKDIPLADNTSPLGCYWEPIWDLLMPDRFWAWVDARLADRIRALADLHCFAEEQDAAHFHPGIPGRVQPATRSWKQVRFDVSNVQLTFHETNKKTITTPDGTAINCVIVEPDINYYKDLFAHGLLEVLPNLLTGGKSDPRQDYSLRWMATKLENLQPDFEPPVAIE